MGQKSIIPDLIFSETREDRIRAIGEMYCQKQLWNENASTDLHRVTVFATHRCNFKCRYCNGPHMNKAISLKDKSDFLSRDLSPELFKKLLKDWHSHGLKYIHFTGGEATLNKNLPGFIKEAAKWGMLSALTTNGSASPEFYRELVLAGLREIRISIDSDDPATFDRIVQVPGAFKRVEKSILELGKMRDRENKNIFMIFNVCLQSFNLEECKNTIKGLLRYKPDDMKMLVIAEDAKGIE
jgi:MoaA/NifB/PqqE/SkfB family radical SAM enzyme